jgi:hypothetical protein
MEIMENLDPNNKYKSMNKCQTSQSLPITARSRTVSSYVMASAKGETESLEQLLEINVKGEDLAEIKRILYGKVLP